MYRAIVSDDEELIRFGISDLLESMNLGIEVVATASDGLETLRIYEEYIPDILFIDINIPHLNGLECIEKIRKSNTTSIIMIISGYDKFEYARKALENGVDYYLLKPLDDDEFYEIMKEALNRFDKRLEEKNIIAKFSPDKPSTKISIIEFINENYTNKEMSSEYIENEYSISRTALYKLVKKATGKSFIEYLTMLRMNHAIRLMEANEDMTFGEIAVLSGYKDQYYFSRNFKKNMGKSPKEYRNSFKRRELNE